MWEKKSNLKAKLQYDSPLIPQHNISPFLSQFHTIISPHFFSGNPKANEDTRGRKYKMKYVKSENERDDNIKQG